MREVWSDSRDTRGEGRDERSGAEKRREERRGAEKRKVERGRQGEGESVNRFDITWWALTRNVREGNKPSSRASIL